MGGLGIRRLVWSRGAAWAASFAAAAPFLLKEWPSLSAQLSNSVASNLRPLLRSIILRHGQDTQQRQADGEEEIRCDEGSDDEGDAGSKVDSDEVPAFQQKFLMRHVDTRIRANLLQRADEESALIKDWLVSLSSSPYAVRWFTHPTILLHLGNSMKGGTFRNALNLLLLHTPSSATDIGGVSHLHCVCGNRFRAAEALVHCVTCAAFRGLRIDRHNEVRDRFEREVTRLRLPRCSTQREPILAMARGRPSRKADLKIAVGADLLLLDFGIVKPKSISLNGNETGGAEAFEAQKRRETNPLLPALNVNETAFQPFIIEATGKQGRAVNGEVFNFLVSKLLDTGIEEKTAREKVGMIYLLITTTVWCYNAITVSSLLNREGLTRVEVGPVLDRED